MRPIHLIYTAILVLPIFSNQAHSADCPAPPQQTAQNVIEETTKTTKSLLHLDSVTVSTRIEHNTSNLLSSTPNSSAAIVSLGILATACSVLLSSNFSADDTAKILRITANSIAKILGNDQDSAPGPTINSSPSKKKSHQNSSLESFVTPDELHNNPSCVPFLLDHSSTDFAELNMYYLLNLGQRIISSGKDIMVAGYVYEPALDGTIQSKAYRRVFGQRRAQAIKSYLVSIGIPSSKIVTIGYGDYGIVQPIGKLYCGVVISPT